MRANHAAAINLTADDMSLIAADQAPQTRMRMASDEAARKEFAKNVRELLAVAEEARVKGVAKRPEIKRQLEPMRACIISQNYSQTQAGAPPVTDAEIEAFFKEPGQEEALKQFIQEAQAAPMMAGQKFLKRNEEIRRGREVLSAHAVVWGSCRQTGKSSSNHVAAGAIVASTYDRTL